MASLLFIMYPRSYWYGSNADSARSMQGYMDTALMLMEHGASVTEKDNKGNTPLLGACIEGHTDIALMLIEHGASLTEKTNDGNTPLHNARCQVILTQLL